MKNGSNTKKEYDIIVIGAGSGGLNIAGFMNTVGFKVLLIDKSDKSIGGDCLNFGCVPSKAFIHVARQVADARASGDFGLDVRGDVDMKAVMDYVRSRQDIIREHENASHFREKGMDVALGYARFTGPQTVSVGEEEYTARKIVIATGSHPRELNLPGIEKVDTVYTNENIFSLEELPKKMAIVGAGPIGVELGQAFAMLGVEVSITGDTFLGKEDPEMASIVRKSLELLGVRIYEGYRPTKVQDAHTLVIGSGDSTEEKEITFDVLLTSIGREFNTESLDLEKAGVEVDRRGAVKVDRYLQTTNRRVVAIGDVIGQHLFTHAAEVHAGVIIKNFFAPFFLKKKLNTDAMAWVTYTDPEIATFGLSEKTLKERNISYEVLQKDVADDDRAITDDARHGLLKVFVSKNGRVLGGTMVARNSGELAQELMLAQAGGMKISAFMKKVYPYPTATRVNRSLFLSHEAKKLTKRTKKILQWLFH